MPSLHFMEKTNLSCIEMEKLGIHAEDHPILSTEQIALSSLTSVTLQNSALAIWMARKYPQIMSNSRTPIGAPIEA